jgi:hypothetical protein
MFLYDYSSQFGSNLKNLSCPVNIFCHSKLKEMMEGSLRLDSGNLHDMTLV